MLSAYGSIDLPMGSVMDGEIIDPEAVSSAIRELWRKAGVTSKDVAIGLSNQKVVVRLIDLPFMDRAELAGAIQYQAQDYIPIPVEEAILDFQIVGEYVTPSDEHMMEVLLVAAQRDMVSSVVTAVEAAGLRPNLIDVTSFAIVRALLGETDGELADITAEPGQATAVVHLSAGLTNIAVVDKGVPRFTRVSSLGGNEFTTSIGNVLNATFDDAERLKLAIGMTPVDASPVQDLPNGVDAATVQAVRDACDREAGKLIAEIRRSLDYYLTQTSQVRTVPTVLLTGSPSQLHNLPEQLEAGLHANVLPADPLERIQSTSKTGPLVEADRYGAAAAIGLAMGGLQS